MSSHQPVHRDHVSSQSYMACITRNLTILALVFPWFMGIVLNISAVPGLGLQTKSFGGCLPSPATSKMMDLMVILGTYVPCTVIGMSYITVLIKAKMSLRRKPGDGGHHLVLLKRYEVSKMLFICFLWFCIANFPVPVTFAFFPVQYVSSPRTQLAFKGLQYVSSAVDPVSAWQNLCFKCIFL